METNAQSQTEAPPTTDAGADADADGLVRHAPSEPEVEPSVACVSEVASVAVCGESESRLHRQLLRSDGVGSLLRAAEEKLYYTGDPIETASATTAAGCASTTSTSESS